MAGVQERAVQAQTGFTAHAERQRRSVGQVFHDFGDSVHATLSTRQGRRKVGIAGTAVLAAGVSLAACTGPAQGSGSSSERPTTATSSAPASPTGEPTHTFAGPPAPGSPSPTESCFPPPKTVTPIDKLVADPAKYAGKVVLIVPGRNSFELGSDPALQQQGIDLSKPVNVKLTDPKTNQSAGNGEANIDFLFATPSDTAHAIIFVAPIYRNPDQFQYNLQGGIHDINEGKVNGFVTVQVVRTTFAAPGQIQPKDGLSLVDLGQTLTSQPICGVNPPGPTTT